MARFVILGSGFGGSYAALHLSSKLGKDDKLVIINPIDTFVFSPLLHEVATGSLSEQDVTIPLASFLRNVKIIRSTVKSIDFTKKTVKTSTANVPYDYLLIALGSMLNKAVIPKGVKENDVLLLKTLDDAQKMKAALAQVAEQQQRTGKDLRILTVGAGATGIEITSEIRTFFRKRKGNGKIHIIMLQNLADIFPDKPEKFRKKIKDQLVKLDITIIYNSSLLSLKNGKATIKTGEKTAEKIETFDTSLVIFTAGVVPVAIETLPKVTNERGSFPVNEFLEVQGAENVWAIGDIAYYVNPVDKKPMPMLAQAARDEATCVAGNMLEKKAGKQQRAYKFYSKGFLMSVGRGNGVGELFGIILSGWLLWWLKRTVYAVAFPGLRNKIRAFWKLSVVSLFK